VATAGDRFEQLRSHPVAAWLGLALIVAALGILPFALASVGTA